MKEHKKEWSHDDPELKKLQEKIAKMDPDSMGAEDAEGVDGDEDAEIS